MRFFSTFILALLLFSFSCKNELEKPKDLIPREEMKMVLKEMYLYRNLYDVDMHDVSGMNESSYAVLENHNIPIDRFKESYKYYLINKTSFNELLNEIKEDLEKDMGNKKPDSINLPMK